MNKITVKVIDVDHGNNTVVLKFASDQSAKSIDEYDPLVFQMINPNIKTLDDFINSIRSELAHSVYLRDQSEKIDIDMQSWVNQTVEISLDDIVLPNSQDQQTPNASAPEVLL